ncbi:hypothetical protein BDK51DRAFT_26107 [Blyttiomyces helicus]|uniref:Uncharacterized protein n=1 Tax=Blyttiomyces helicus TaxID=388810 RepID=A0A4P9WP56_9FUNG|nr:hypothetical protein BDK51DRAFT_26107 [Blyttiomyces helicus]|eukprot:RKO93508.1 hypothetical protein BDK51DRAFT_26107 [Blyttiomyces helicus]
MWLEGPDNFPDDLREAHADQHCRSYVFPVQRRQCTRNFIEFHDGTEEWYWQGNTSQLRSVIVWAPTLFLHNIGDPSQVGWESRSMAVGSWGNEPKSGGKSEAPVGRLKDNPPADKETEESAQSSSKTFTSLLAAGKGRWLAEFKHSISNRQKSPLPGLAGPNPQPSCWRSKTDLMGESVDGSWELELRESIKQLPMKAELRKHFLLVAAGTGAMAEGVLDVKSPRMIAATPCWVQQFMLKFFPPRLESGHKGHA